MPIKSTKKKRKVKYLSNTNMLEQFNLSMEKGEMTTELAKMLLLLATQYSMKGNFAGYSFREDMVGEALLILAKKWDKFDITKSDNIFSYYTSIIHNQFILTLNHEKKHRNMRDRLLVYSGQDPSDTYMTEYEQHQRENNEISES